MISHVRMLGPEGMGSYSVDWSAPTFVFEPSEKPSSTLVVPGFVDIHFHGAFGLDFMSMQSGDWPVLCRKLEAEGYEGFLPTTVTAPCSNVLSAIHGMPNHPMVLGFHLEGPFISRDYPGAQPQNAIADVHVEPSEWDEVFQHPKLRVITIAPEKPNALDLISRLAQRGVVVSMGHSNATYDEARFGFEFGAANTTHTFNAMRGFHHREAGLAGYALSNPDLNCELIYDRIHVCKEAAQVLIQAKPADRLIAVSDSTMATGMPPNLPITMWGVEAETGRNSVTLRGTSTLAGSGISLLQAFQHLAQDFGEELAIRACSLNPRRVLGITSKPKVYCEFSPDYELLAVHNRIELQS